MLSSNVHKEHTEVTWGHVKPLGHSAHALPLTQAHMAGLKDTQQQERPRISFLPPTCSAAGLLGIE